MYLQYIFYIDFAKNWNYRKFENYGHFSILQFELRVENYFLAEKEIFKQRIKL